MVYPNQDSPHGVFPVCIVLHVPRLHHMLDPDHEAESRLLGGFDLHKEEASVCT
jgi:hypothetical protein